MNQRPDRPDKSDAQPKGAHDRRTGRLNDRILDAFAQLETGTPADVALRNTFKKARDLGSSERAQVADIFYGMIRKRRLIEDRLRRSAKAEKKHYEDLDLPIRHRLILLGQQALEGASLKELEARDGYAFKRIPNLFKRIQKNRLASAKRSEEEELAIELSLPTWVVRSLVKSFGKERTTQMGQALLTRAPFTLRVNRLRGTRDEAQDRILKDHGVECTPTRFSPDGLILPHPVDLNTWPLFKEGWLEPQDEGSQLIALAVDAKPGEAVLDACAGAGGKTLALAAQMKGQGRLVATDIEKKKIQELKRRLRQSEVRCETQIQDLLELPEALQNSFDAVLIDAPCTGSGVLRRSPDLLWQKDEATLKKELGRQKRLLASTKGALKPGGRLVYATCSILKEENEDITAYLAEHDGALVPEPLPKALRTALSLAEDAFQTRVGPGPSPQDPDGFFIATFRLQG